MSSKFMFILLVKGNSLEEIVAYYFFYGLVFFLIVTIIFVFVRRKKIKEESKRLNEMESLEDNHENPYRDFTEGHAYEK